MKRIQISIIAGALLGVLCIVGVGFRVGFSGNWPFLFSMWYNRVLMGVLIGFAGGLKIVKSKFNIYLRGFVLGLLVTSAHAFSTGFRDIPSFFAGLAYGLIIDFLASKYDR